VVRGRLAAGWDTDTVVIPVSAAARHGESGTVCIRDLGPGAVRLYGTPVPGGGPAKIAGHRLPGQLHVAFLRHGRESWWSVAAALPLRMSKGNAGPLGQAAFWLAVVLMLAAITLVVRALWGAAGAGPGQTRRIPRAAWLCALVAVINGLAWAIIVPPFQVPDENVHLAYAQHLAETGVAPRPVPGRHQLSAEQRELEALLGTPAIVGDRQNAARWYGPINEQAADIEADHPPRSDGGGASNALNNPPLYYLMGAVPYWLSPSHALLHRLFWMRVLSALLGGVTVLAIFLFLREALPGTPWAWTVGALGAALSPLFGFISGGFNNDNLLYLAAALLFLALARAFRRGLTWRRGMAIGAAVALGLLAKPTFLGLVPGALVGLALLGWRAHRREDLPRLLGGAWGGAAAVVAVPVGAYVAVNALVWSRPLWSAGAAINAVGGGASGAATSAGTTLASQASYLWQLYLPRLPFMTNKFPGFPDWNVWFHGMVGEFGWLDYGFPGWVYWLALALVAGVAASAGAAIVHGGPARLLRTRGSELCTYAVVALGLLALIGEAAYHASLGGQGFVQARYLLPLLPLWAALLAVGARGAGRRFALAAGAVIVMLALGHDLFSQIITVGRYWT
jgi:4-amino-4-deoxy-L-arabinose transferase-like glycosyltransferase